MGRVAAITNTRCSKWGGRSARVWPEPEEGLTRGGWLAQVDSTAPSLLRHGPISPSSPAAGQPPSPSPGLWGRTEPARSPRWWESRVWPSTPAAAAGEPRSASRCPPPAPRGPPPPHCRRRRRQNLQEGPPSAPTSPATTIPVVCFQRPLNTYPLDAPGPPRIIKMRRAAFTLRVKTSASTQQLPLSAPFALPARKHESATLQRHRSPQLPVQRASSWSVNPALPPARQNRVFFFKIIRIITVIIIHIERVWELHFFKRDSSPENKKWFASWWDTDKSTQAHRQHKRILVKKKTYIFTACYPIITKLIIVSPCFYMLYVLHNYIYRLLSLLFSL